MASVHILNLYTTVNLLYNIDHLFAMIGKDNNNEWEADNFSSLLTVFPITEIYNSRSLSVWYPHWYFLQ